METFKDMEKFNEIEIFRDGLHKFRLNNNQDLTIYSNIPEKCTSKACYVGIDEAGRGPVLGPMLYGIFCAVIDEDAIEKLKENGKTMTQIEENPPTNLASVNKLNDSKQLTEKLREQIFLEMADQDTFCYGLKFISPTQISSKCFRRQKCSLNEVSHDAAIELIKGMLERGVKIAKVYLDTVGPMDKYQKKLEGIFPDLRFKVDKKADSKYQPVSAASVCAKVARDLALKYWTYPSGSNVAVGTKGWGSGYPADPETKKFLRANIDPIFGFPNVVRNSWSTAKSLMDDKGVKVTWDTGESELDEDAPAPKIRKYFAKSTKQANGNAAKYVPDRDDDKPKQSIRKAKSQFFFCRNLEQTVSL